MLSRVAERIYWTARYLQRAESMARLVNVYTNLLMDLPSDIDISWYNLVTLNSSESEYDARYKIRDERNVVKFNIADDSHANSMAECIKCVRENLRTTRDVMPENAWELINELSSFVENSIKDGGLNRGKRHEFLNSVINQCQMIQGYVASTVSHDEVWDVWCLGRGLERADMTTRILDAGANILKNHNYGEESHVPTVIWGNVLKSSGAHHAYRQKVSAEVLGDKVAGYLILDDKFPRSVNFCLHQIFTSIKALPRGRKVMATCKELDIALTKTKSFDSLGQEFSDYLNDLQVKIGRLHNLFSDTWFAIK